MIRISLDGGGELFIKGEDRQWVVGKVGLHKKSGKETFDGDSYYSSIEGMIKGVCERKVRLSEMNSITDLRMNLRNAMDELKGLFDTTYKKGE